MTRLLRKEKEAMIVQVNPTGVKPEVVPTNPALQQLLDKYSDFFTEPTDLPPTRKQDHKIELMPNAAPVSVRPYRYPHFQKAEIERIVQELLDNGLIRPSVSPFSSPVLLVKKKDGTWRMCVDYRKLNDITIKDKFPMPVIENLLSELHGAEVFSKLDLRQGYFQIRLKGTDKDKTALVTHQGQYEFNVMLF